MFLKEHGVPLPLAQRVAERCGQQTVARVRGDPYATMAGSGLPFRCAAWHRLAAALGDEAPAEPALGLSRRHTPAATIACRPCCGAFLPSRLKQHAPPHPPTCSKVDQLAAKVGAPADLVSRAAMAMQQCLGAAAAEEGHTFLPWHRLERDCGRLLEEAGRHHGTPWEHAGALHLVAQYMHACGRLVAEPAGGGPAAEEAAGGQVEQATAAELGSASAAAAGVPQPGPAAAPARVHPDFAGDLAALREYLGHRLKGVRCWLRKAAPTGRAPAPSEPSRLLPALPGSSLPPSPCCFTRPHCLPRPAPPCLSLPLQACPPALLTLCWLPTALLPWLCWMRTGRRPSQNYGGSA